MVKLAKQGHSPFNFNSQTARENEMHRKRMVRELGNTGIAYENTASPYFENKSILQL